jgi:sulfate adenylyltransferase
VHEEDVPEFRSRAQTLPRVQLSQSELNDFGLIANGAFSPLIGFMRKKDYTRVVDEMRLANGTVWSLPVTLSVPSDNVPKEGSEVALYDGTTLRGTMRVEEVYKRNKACELREVYRTQDEAHPGVARVLGQSDTLIGGYIWALPPAPHNAALNGDAQHYSLSLTPRETRAAFKERAWRTIVAFQTRNLPPPRAHNDRANPPARRASAVSRDR